MASLSFDLRPRPPSPGGGGALPSPPLEPRQWQRRLIQLLRARLLNPGDAGADVLIHAGPGAGKTLGALLAFQRLHREGHLRRFVIFTHRSSISRQWLIAAQGLGLDLRGWEPRQAADHTPPVCGAGGVLISYQAAARHRQRLERELPAGEPWLAIADEVHHLGVDPEEPEAAAWGHAFSRLTGGARLRLGLTGTPFRADQLAFCAARRIRVHEHGAIAERIVPDLSVEPRRLILAGDVRPLEFRFQDGWVEHGRRDCGDNPESVDRERSPLSAEQRESWRARNLRRAVRLGDASGIAVRLLLNSRQRLERLRRHHPGAGGLVVARDIAHARAISALLREQGDQVQLVHSQDGEAASRLGRFKTGEGDWLVSIDMCSEGFDAPRLRVVTYLTTVVTRSRFVQAITRAVRMDGERAAVEPIPRQASTVFAPADPLLIGYARGWSLSEPYLIRARAEPGDPVPAEGTCGQAGSSRLEAMDDNAGHEIRLGGPALPPFL